MKRKLILFVFITSLIYFFNACNESSTNQPTPPNQEADSSYFPAEDSTYYKYSIMRPDSNNNQTAGTRSSFYNGTEIKGNITYQVQIDSVFLSGQAAVEDSMYFRKTNSGIFFYLDTTGLAASVPGLDTLLQYITLDTEMRLLLFPIYDNSGWNVFKMNINYQGFNFNPIELKASFDGIETLTLNLTPSRIVEAVRLKFTLTIKPGLFVIARSYTAFGWIAAGIGFVKWNGNGTIVGVFTGNGVDLDDTTSVFSDNLIEYNRID